MKKILFAFVSILLFCSAEASAPEDGKPILFLFQRNSDILVASYRSNPAGLEYLQQSVNSNKAALRDFRGHFRIVSFIFPQDNTLDRENSARVHAAISRYNPIPFSDIVVMVNEMPPYKSQNVEVFPSKDADSVRVPSSDTIEEEKNIAVIPSYTTYSAATPSPQPAEFGPAYQRLGGRNFPLVGVKTNLLLFAGLYPDFIYYAVTPNIALEVYFAGCWSVNADYAYSGRTLSADDTQKRFGYSSVGVEPRFWFSGDDRFKGFYGGAYAAYVQSLESQYDVPRKSHYVVLTLIGGRYHSHRPRLNQCKGLV